MSAHNTPLDQLLQSFSTDAERGLTAGQAQKALAQYGENKLQEKKKKSNLQRFLAQFKDVMIIILLIAAAISFGIACTTGETSEFFEPVLFCSSWCSMLFWGCFRRVMAEKALDALKNYPLPTPSPAVGRNRS